VSDSALSTGNGYCPANAMDFIDIHFKEYNGKNFIRGTSWNFGISLSNSEHNVVHARRAL
jgi:hypothetical protein